MPYYLPTKYFRPGSHTTQKEVNFVYNAGGIGDYVCFSSAMIWIATHHPQITGHVWAPLEFLPLAEAFFRPFPHWSVKNRDLLNKEELKKRPMLEPLVGPPNGCGINLVDLGFMWFCNLNPPPPEGNFYPQLSFTPNTKSSIPNLADNEKYIVLTAGASHTNRVFPAKVFNGIKEHALAKGLKVVVLGKTQVNPERQIIFSKDYDFENTISLIDKTDILVSAFVMSRAQAVVGLDNGLLHVAATTDVPIVFGFNIASPIHRSPRRRVGATYEIYPDPAVLTCTFCQSQMRFMANHDFKNCIYKDLRCLDELSDPKPWCDLLDEAISERTTSGAASRDVGQHRTPETDPPVENASSR